jgi:hypothetical protein
VRRRLLTFSAVLSFLLCVASTAAAVRSFDVTDRVVRFRADGSSVTQLVSARGALSVAHYRVDRSAGGTRMRLLDGTVLVPYPFAAIVFAALPVVWITAWIQRRRRPVPGLCPKCGYDLRATPERCPECGAVPAGVGANHEGTKATKR